MMVMISPKHKITPDLIVFPHNFNQWVLMNVRTRTTLGVTHHTFAVLNQLQSQVDDRLYHEQQFAIWDFYWFSNYAGALEDPSRFNRDDWGVPNIVSYAELLEYLIRYQFIIDDEVAYRAQFATKTGILDFAHIGNYHQQLGTELLLNRREDPKLWWINQKFTANLKQILPNLYGAVQDEFLKNYFPHKLASDDTVLDLGCGTGYYSCMMAQYAKHVVGIDPDSDHIERAQADAPHNTSFYQMAIGIIGGMDSIPEHTYDVVFMSDALLFYFVPPAPNFSSTLEVLMRDIKRVLKPNGIFISVEPHATFWLKPWLGTVDQPFTIITEYTDYWYSVAPTLEQLIRSVIEHGFLLSDIQDILPVQSFVDVNPRAYHFAKNFPQWHLIEFTPRPS